MAINYDAKIERSKNYGVPLTDGYPNDPPGSPRERHAGGHIDCPNTECGTKGRISKEQMDGKVSVGCNQCGAHYFIRGDRILWLGQNYRNPNRG